MLEGAMDAKSAMAHYSKAADIYKGEVRAPTCVCNWVSHRSKPNPALSAFGYGLCMDAQDQLSASSACALKVAQFASEAEEYDPALQLLATTNHLTTRATRMHVTLYNSAATPLQLIS